MAAVALAIAALVAAVGMTVLFHAALLTWPSSSTSAESLARLGPWVTKPLGIGWLALSVLGFVLGVRSRAVAAIGASIVSYAAGWAYLLWWSRQVAEPTAGGISSSEVLEWVFPALGLWALLVSTPLALLLAEVAALGPERR